MSRSRLVLRLLLVLLLLGVCGVAGVAWYNSKGGGHLSRAESAMQSGDFETAKIHLMNALDKQPDNGRAHELMGELMLAQAKTKPGQPDNYVTNAAARDELKAAAKLQPDNLPLQKKLLEVFLARGSMAAAAEVAEVIVKVEPNHADALLALGIEDVRLGRKAEGEEKLGKYLAAPTTHVFRGYQAALVLDQGEENVEKRQELFDRVASTAAGLTASELAVMPLDEQLLLSGLLQASIAAAPNAEKADQRVAATLSVSEKVAEASGQQAPQLAQLIATAMSQLRDRYPARELSPSAVTKRGELEGRASTLLTAFVESGVAVPSVYLQAATAARESREYDKACEVLDAGIKACADLPADRRTELEALHLMAARNLVMMRRYNDAAPHLEVLKASDDNAVAGWGELLSGGVASAEGRHGDALRHYQRAQGKLGRTPFVEVALAKTFLQLGNFDEALPRLQALQQVLDTADPEQQSWAQLHGVVRDQVAWDKFRANLALGRWDAAETQRAALAGTSREPQAEALAATYLVRQGKTAEAEQRLAAAVDKHSDSATLRHALIGVLYVAGKTAEAEGMIDQMAGADDLTSLLAVAFWRTKQGRVDDAVAVLDAARQQHPDSTAPDLLKARILLANDQPREALAIAERLKTSPQAAPAGKVIELLEAIDQQRFDEASAQLSELSAEASTITPAMNLLAGTLSAATGDLQSAVQQIGNSLGVTSLDRQSHRTLVQAVLALAAKEGPEAATAALQPLLSEYPHNALLHVVHADLLFKQGQLAEGRAALDRAERELPSSPVVPYLKAATWTSAGDIQQGLSEANRALAIDATYLPARLLAAQLQLATGRPSLALATATRLVQDSPRLWNAYFLKAEAERQLGRVGDAVRTLTAAVQTEPKLIPGYRGLMSLLLGAGRADEALALCQKAREASPDEVALMLDEITIQVKLEHLDEAKQLAETLLASEELGELSPAIRALSLAQTFSSVGQTDLAVEWARRALQTADGDERIAAELFLGELALVVGQASGDRARLAEARDHFARIVESQPQNFVAANNLAWLLATEFNDPGRAVEVAETLRGEAPASALPLGFIDTLAEVYRAAGETQKARQLLEQAQHVYPDNSVLMYHLGMLLAESNESTAATNLLERALSVGGLTDAQQAEVQQALDQLAAARTAPPSAP